MAPLVFSNRIVNAMSWATDAPGGFAEADVELFRDLVTGIRLRSPEATAGRRIYGELLATYVGRDPGVRRSWRAPSYGAKSIISKQQCCWPIYAVSSRLTDELPEEQIVELLNAFFDLVEVPGVVAGGGWRSGHIGDAVIAIFPVAGDDPAPACEFGSGCSAEPALAAPPERATGDPAAYFPSISLCTYGVAAYGNIGSGNRLDFSVVGRDVNILSRLELLCKDVGRPLLMTDAFAVEVAEPVFEIGHSRVAPGFSPSTRQYTGCAKRAKRLAVPIG